MAKRKAKGRKAKSSIDTSGYKYGLTRIRDSSGKLHYSRGNQDAVATAMLVHLAAGGTVQQVVKANDLKIKADGNAGTVRMAVGVALRGLVRNGTPVKIGKISVKTLKQKVALPKVEAKALIKGKRKTKKAKVTRRKRSAPKPVEAPASAPAEQQAA